MATLVPSDDREQVALDALARDVGAVAPLPAGDLVDLVDEDDPRGLRAFDCQAGDLIVVEQPVLLLLQDHLSCIDELQRLASRLGAEETRHQVLELDIHFLDALRREDLEGWRAPLAHLDFDEPVLEQPRAELAAKLLAGRLDARIRVGTARRRNPILGPLRRRRAGQQQIEQALFDVRLGLGPALLELRATHHVDGVRHQVANHRLDVAAHVADLREFRGFDLQERAS